MYVIVSIGIYKFQDRVIFQGTELAKDYTFKFDQNFSEFFIETPDGETLDALLFPAAQPRKGLILYFHGNADNLQRWGEYAKDLTSLGYDVLMTDYRGYGKSTGTPDEKKLYDDAETILKWAESNLPTTRLVIYGRSLGSGVASHLAMAHTPYILILETPFDELESTIYPPFKPILNFLPLQHHFPNKEFLPKTTCRKVILHGTDDLIVPLSSALKLKSLLAPTDTFIVIEGGGHRNLREFADFHKALKEALE